MKEKLLYVFVALAMLAGFLQGGVPTPVSASPTIIHVPGDYATIQAAIDAASPGNTILVASGNYTENINVNKSVIIQSVNGANVTTVQAANSTDHVFEVTADNVTIALFKIRGASGQDKAGIYVGNGRHNVKMAYNIIADNHRGISLSYADNNQIIGNDISTVTAGGYLGPGILLDHANNNAILQNTLKSNTYYGIYLYFATYNRIEGNDISNNWGGIVMDRGQNNTLTGNNITANTAQGITMEGANNANNIIYLNNFINSSNFWMAPDSNNTWSSPEQLSYRFNSAQFTNYLGNYWSNYIGLDVNVDGIGDTPYPIIGTNNDNYPLKMTSPNYQIVLPAISPTVTTDNATSIIGSSAVLNGNLTSLGSALSANVSFELGLVSGNYTGTSPAFPMNSTGAFSINIAGLSANTTYYFRAKAVGDSTGYGVEKSFTTLSAPAQTGKIAFIRNGEVYAMNADGSYQTRLTNNGWQELSPAWSPDGTKIAFVRLDSNYRIYVMNADGSNQTQLTNYALGDYVPAWSPDSTKIAFGHGSGNSAVYVMNADGSNQTQLTPDGQNPTWSPDGTKIAFGYIGVGGIWAMNANGSNQTQLTTDGEDPAWSSDGTRIAFVRRLGAPADIYVMNADGTGQTRLTDNAAEDRTPVWSPDSSMIAFESQRDGNPEIYVMNANGTNQHRITNDPAEDTEPSWAQGSLAPGGTISGHVYQSDNTTPIEGAKVAVFKGVLNVIASAFSDVNGYYQLTGLPTGQYVLQANAAGYAAEWYRDSITAQGANPVPVNAPGDTSGIDFTLEPGSTISGHVYQQGTTAGIEGALVIVTKGASGGIAWTLSAADGSYITPGLPAGEYGLWALVQGYAGEWYQESSSSANATLVQVTVPGNVSGKDFTLEVGSSISGHVYQSDNVTPITGAQVVAFGSDVNLGPYGIGWAGADGSYTTTGLLTGNYTVQATAPGYVTEWYNNVYNQNQATPVSVTVPINTPNINFSLAPPAPPPPPAPKWSQLIDDPAGDGGSEDIIAVDTFRWPDRVGFRVKGTFDFGNLKSVTHLDVDQNATTGRAVQDMGSDYCVVLTSGSVNGTLMKWDVATTNWTSIAPIGVTSDNTSFWFEVMLSQLGNDQGNMDVVEVVGTLGAFPEAVTDVAPDTGHRTVGEPQWAELIADPTGDQVGAGPDLTGLDIHRWPNRSGGDFRVRANGMNFADLKGSTYIDLDQNPATGYNGTQTNNTGADLVLVASSRTDNVTFPPLVGKILSWNGTDWQFAGGLGVFIGDGYYWIGGVNTNNDTRMNLWQYIGPSSGNATDRMPDTGYVTNAPRETVGESTDDGLAWLAAQQNTDGSWGTKWQVAKTGLAVLKLETHATSANMSPFDPAYPYKAQVEKGLDYLFANSYTTNISPQPAGNPDSNNNSIGAYFYTANLSGEKHYVPIYETGITLMAVAASNAPDRVVNVAGSPVNGWTYQRVATEAVDYLAWSQTDRGFGRGGWNYEPMNNQGDRSDQSNTGWVTLGLAYAESPAPLGFSLPIPGFVRSELDIWIDYIQDDVNGDADDGGAWYTGPSDPWGENTGRWVNTLKTGNLLQQMAFVGDTTDTPRVQAALDYLVRHWNDANSDPGWRGGLANYHATYTIMKGLEAFHLNTLTSGNVTIDWFADFVDALLYEQNPNGSWPSSNFDDGEQILSTEWALLTLQKTTAPTREGPDLVVFYKYEEWVDQGAGIYRVNAVVANQGNLMSPAGVVVGLVVDGNKIEEQPVYMELAPQGPPWHIFFSTNITLTGDGDTVMVVVDPNNLVPELNEDNNQLINGWPPKPDLTITGKNENWVDELAKTYKVYFTVKNSGNVIIPAGYDIGLLVDGNPIEQAPMPQPLAPDESYDGGFINVLTLSGTSDNITVTVDINNEVFEVDEANNSLTNTWTWTTKPDLWLMEKHEVWVQSGISYMVSFTIKNQGNVPAPAGSDVALWVDGIVMEQKAIPLSLSPNATYTDNFTTVITLSGSYDNVTVEADFNKEMDESNEGNNHRGNTFAWPPAPDLTVYKWETWQIEGQSYVVNFKVNNMGNAPAPAGFDVGLFVDGNLIEQKARLEPLDAGAGYNDVFSTSVNLTGGMDKVRVYVDVNNEVVEPNEGNWNDNVISWPPAPDLTFNKKWESWVAGQEGTQYTVSFDMANLGNADAPAGFDIQLIVDGNVIETLTTPGILKAQSSTGKVTFSTNVTLTGGSDNVTVVADAYNGVVESDETNNSLSNTWTWTTKPDLWLMEKHEVWVVPGSQYMVLFTIKNNGNVAAPAGHDTALWVDGVVIEQKAVPVSLAPGATYTDNFTIVVSLSGSYDSVTVETDFNKEVDESNEGNRQGFTIAWPPLPDLTVTNKYEQWMGDQYVVLFTIKNQGNAPAPNTHIPGLFIDGVQVEPGGFPMFAPQVPVLAPGESYNGVFSSVPLTGGVDKVRVVADVTNLVAESREDNNTRENTFAWPAAPDLLVNNKYEKWVEGQVGTQYFVGFEVQNIGNADALAGHDVQLVVDGQVIETKEITMNLGRWQSWKGTFSTNVTISGGSDNVTVIADANNGVVESDETNNSRTNTWSLGKPDLWLMEKHEVWLPGQEGNQYVVGFTIKNNGNVAAPTGPTGYDTALSVDGKRIEQKPVLVSIAPGATYSDNFTTVITLSDGRDDVNVSTDVNYEVDESDETNNSRGNTFTWPPSPDLRISLWEEWNVNGQSYTVRFEVRNRGNAPAPGGHIIALFVEDAEIARKVVPIALAPGDFYQDSFNTVINLSGVDKVKVVADITNIVAESNENNNSYENMIVWPPAPDLIISSKSERWIAGQEGAQYNVDFQVRNNGNTNATTGHDVQLKVDGNVIETQTVPATLGRGQSWSSSFSTNVTISGSSDNVTVTADANSEVAESDETNNSRSNTWTAKPDLTVSEKHEVWTVEGSQYIVSFTLRNTGNVAAPSGHDTALFIDGNLIEQKPMSLSLAAGASYSANFSTVVNVSGNSDNVTVLTDYNNAVDEFNETNNSRSNTWTAKPDLIVSEFREVWVAGVNQYVVSFTIKNQGSVTAPTGHDAALTVDGNIIEQKVITVPLAAGATYTDNFTTVVNLSDGWDMVSVPADYNSEVDESNETNNRRSSTIASPPAPDIVVTGKYEEWVQQGTQYKVHFTMTNNGNAATPAGPDVALDVDGSVLEQKAMGILLAPGESYSGVFNTVVNLTGGMDKVKVSADINNEVIESREDNNFRENTIAWPAAPDLTVSMKSEQWVVGKEGIEYNVRFGIRNIGNANAPAGHEVQLKVDGNLIETVTVPVDLGQGNTYSGAIFSANVTLSGTSDNVTVIADANNDVAESDEANNSFTNIWPGAPPAPSGVQVKINAPAKVAPNHDFTVFVDISQVQNLDAANYDVSFNPNILSLGVVTNGIIWGTTVPVAGWNQSSPGTYTIVQNIPGLSGVSGSGYLAVLHFHVLGSLGQSSNITLTNGTLSHIEAINIPATWLGDSVEVASVIPGDANEDGEVNAIDITKVERIIARLDAPTPGADANEDGFIDAIDITKVELIIVGRG